MEKLKTKIKVTSVEFRQRSELYKSFVLQFRKTLKEVMIKRDVDALKKYISRKKLLVRDRINLLIDENSPFLELSALAALDKYNNDFPSAGIVSGIGIIHGKETVIIANDSTVKGGTYVEETIKKHLRAQEIALSNHLPCVYLVDSGGIFLPEQAKVFPDKNDFGRIFYNQAILSSSGIPQISVVMGSSTAGGAYIPAMSDQTIIVKDQGTIFLGGPPLVKAATGEVVSANELGGALVHTGISGVADHLAFNDEHALQICRDIFETIPGYKKQILEVANIEEPDYDPEELYGILPLSPRENIDPHEIIMRIVDGSRFNEFKASYATTLVTGFARIMGFPVGIIANFGVLYSESALKATHFIELCNFRKIPIFFLQNITGFMVGKEAENRGIAKDGAKMVHAVATAVVPKFTVIFGGSYGAGNYAMAGRAYDPRLLFMYPNSSISVMGGEQAANVLVAIKKEKMIAAEKDMDYEDELSTRNKILEKYSNEGSAYYSTSRVWDDGIIDPAETRKIIAMGISMTLNKKYDDPHTGIFRM